MTEPKTKDAVNRLVKEAGRLLNDPPAARRAEDYLYMFSLVLDRIGKDYLVNIGGRKTPIVPEKIVSTYENIKGVIERYFNSIEVLDSETDKKVIARFKKETHQALEKMRMK